MPTYAILGATGNVGTALLRVLLQSRSNHIHAYCRSKQKLFGLLPELAEDERVTVFEGGLDDTQVLEDCLRDCHAAFLAVAQKGNIPGCSIALDTARAVVAALEKLDAAQVRLPRLVVLSSASTEHRLMRAVPSFLLAMLYRAMSNVYDDLKEAEAYLRAQESLVSARFVKPGALCDDAQKGHAISLEEARSPISFLDLAAGMIDVADDEGNRYEGRGVAVNATAEDVAFPWTAPVQLVKGLLLHFLPWTYAYLK